MSAVVIACIIAALAVLAALLIFGDFKRSFDSHVQGAIDLVSDDTADATEHMHIATVHQIKPRQK
jgi:hypothetical protein